MIHNIDRALMIVGAFAASFYSGFTYRESLPLDKIRVERVEFAKNGDSAIGLLNKAGLRCGTKVNEDVLVVHFSDGRSTLWGISKDGAILYIQGGGKTNKCFFRDLDIVPGRTSFGVETSENYVPAGTTP